jgi:hypothetical protein
MSWKRTIFAFAILVLMVMALFLDNQIIHTKIIEKVRAESLTDSVNIRDVDQVYLKNSQGTVHLIRTSVGWRMKDPVDAPADPEIVETMLTNVTSARRRNDVESKNLAQYGLANPEIELTLVTDTAKFRDWGTSFGLQLGYESTYTGQVFGRYPGKDKVFTVGEHVKNSLLRSPLDFRRSRLFEINTGDLNQYSAFRIAEADGEGVTLTNVKGKWTITEPAEASAEQKVVDEYFNRLGMLRAVSYVTAKSDRPTSMAAALEALTSPTVSITLQGPATSRPQQLNVAVAEGAEGPVYVAQRPGEQEIMVLTSETVDETRRKAQYFRSRELFTLKKDDVGLFTVQIARAAPTALVRNDKGEWELVGDPEFRINQDAVTERLNALVNIRIEDYVDLNPVDLGNYGLDNPRIRFNVTSKDKKKTETLEVGSPQNEGNGGLSYARSSADKGVFTVQLSPEMLIVASQIADKNFAKADPARLVRAEIDLDGKTYELKKEGNEWKLLKPSQSSFATVDIRQVATLLSMTNTLEYDEDVSAQGKVVVAPNEGPKISIRFYGADDTPLNEMNVTARINRATTLVTNGRGRTFEVSSQAIDKIYAAAKNLVK